jgi:hypothetical protein|tara:strand:- start:1825 stop:2994 length:1170 start_codon:yes stop_codon:yes gene_type:complete
MNKIYISTIVFMIFLVAGCNNGEQKNNELQKKQKVSPAFSSATQMKSSSTDQEVLVIPELNIKLTPFVADFEESPDASILLRNRINTAVAKAGYGGGGGNPRFIIGPNVSLISQDITSTAPTQYANVYELNFMVVDVVTETIFASQTIQAKGVGFSPQKSFISALRNINLQSAAFMKFLLQGQTKAMRFFDENCSNMLAEAEAEARTRNFEGAYAVLNSIPSDAQECFAKIQEKKIAYFQMTLNVNCAELLSKMRAELGKFNDSSASGFNPQAMSYYSIIDKQSDCYDDAQKEYNSYTAKLDPKAKRNWDMEMRKYKDEIEMTKQDREAKQDSFRYKMDHDAKLAEIKAKADVEGNQKLLAKYKHDESPWLVRLFSSGSKLWKGEMSDN